MSFAVPSEPLQVQGRIQGSQGMVGAPLKAEISFPAAVFANVPALSCSGVVSLNFSHCPSRWKPVLLPLGHSKLEIHFVI